MSHPFLKVKEKHIEGIVISIDTMRGATWVEFYRRSGTLYRRSTYFILENPQDLQRLYARLSRLDKEVYPSKETVIFDDEGMTIDIEYPDQPIEL